MANKLFVMENYVRNWLIDFNQIDLSHGIIGKTNLFSSPYGSKVISINMSESLESWRRKRNFVRDSKFAIVTVQTPLSVSQIS